MIRSRRKSGYRPALFGALGGLARVALLLGWLAGAPVAAAQRTDDAVEPSSLSGSALATPTPGEARASVTPTAVRRISGPCGDLSFALVLDVTGSMNGALASVQQELVQILDELERASGGSYEGSLVTFDNTVSVEVPLAPGNRAALESRIRGLMASGGGDEPEAHDEAIRTVVEGLPAAGRPQSGDFQPPFRPDSTRIILVVSDARPGGFHDRFEAGSSDVAALAVAQEAAEAGIRINAVYIPTNPDAEVGQAARQVMEGYARITGGQFTQTDRDGRGTAAAIRSALRACGLAAGPAGATRSGGDTVQAIGDSTLDILSGILPWLLVPGILIGLLIVLPLFALGCIVARNWVMHVINNGHQFLATAPEALWTYLQGANIDLDTHFAEKAEQWKVWALPGGLAEADATWPTKSSPYHGFALTAWMLPLALFILCFLADLIFLGLGASYLLGLPLEAAAGKPIAFGLTLEAILAGLAAITPGTVFGATICAINWLTADGDKPWGNAHPEVRSAVQRACKIGLAIWAVGLVCFAVYRADLIVADAAGASLTGRRLLATLPYIFVPVFTVTLGAASILTFWSTLISINALYLLSCLLIRRTFGLLAWLAQALVVGIDRWDAFVISIWDWICKGPNTVWNANAGIGRKLLGMPLGKINHCERVVIGSGWPASEYHCYCTPSSR